MIDTHCHLSYAPMSDDIDGVIARAKAVGVSHIIGIGTRLEDCLKCRELAAKHKEISCVVGIHPHEAGDVADEEVAQVTAMFADPRVIAAGEMGLDYHYDFAPRDKQQKLFERELAAANAARKPVVLHCRESVSDSLAMLKSAGTTAGVFHCFTGAMEEARRILDAGFYLGFTGVITFKKTDYLREVVKMVPADRILIETDAPYLAPEPMRRQKNNEPSLIVHTFRKAAELRGVGLEELDRQTTANAVRAFGAAVSA